MSAPAQVSSASDIDTVLLDHGLRAQARMFPYTLGFFGIGLPLFLWAMRAAVSPGIMVLYILLLTAGWPLFMALRGQAERLADGPQDKTTRDARMLRQGTGGALWTGCLLIISLTAISGGSNADVLITICAGAAVGIIFFSAPVLLYLLILGPLAVAGPIIALHAVHEDAAVTQLMGGGLVLALAMGLVLNRHMRDHYLLQHEALEAARLREIANASRIAVMETLSREVTTGLSGIAQSLSVGLTHLSRAPAPRQQVEAALDEVGHLQSILTTTLDNDGAEAGQIAVDCMPVDIALICQQMIEDFADAARGRDLVLGLSGAERPASGSAIGDVHRVEQILGHLLANALQYTTTGRVELKLLAPTDGTIRIEVVDSGPGLSAAELDQAFMPHTRIVRTSSGTSGAGLGLSLSRSLAELMGGTMGAESVLDVGSKFWLDLPFDRTQSFPARAETVAEPEAEDHSLRVLLLANDALRAAQLRDQLEGMGHRCLTSTSRERAVALAKKGGIDACVISTGPFENLQAENNREGLSAFLESLRGTQEAARMTIVALLPAGDQAETLQEMGVKPVLLPQARDSLARALAQV